MLWLLITFIVAAAGACSVPLDVVLGAPVLMVLVIVQTL